jgi:hypothetical protein
MTTKKKGETLPERTASIGRLLQQKKSKADKSWKVLFARTEPLEEKLSRLNVQHGQALSAYVHVKFNMGEVVSQIMKEVKNARFKGGWQAYHRDRRLPLSALTLKRYAEGYQDIASLNWKQGLKPVLDAVFEAGIDPIQHVSKIKVAKTQVQNMMGPELVAFLKQKATRKARSKPGSVAEFIAAGMDALGDLFGGIADEAEQNQAWAGIAYNIGVVSEEAAFTEAFSVKSPLATDELDELLRDL